MILVADKEINEKYKILYHFCFLTSHLVLGEHQYSHLFSEEFRGEFVWFWIYIEISAMTLEI